MSFYAPTTTIGNPRFTVRSADLMPEIDKVPSLELASTTQSENDEVDMTDPLVAGREPKELQELAASYSERAQSQMRLIKKGGSYDNQDTRAVHSDLLKNARMCSLAAERLRGGFSAPVGFSSTADCDTGGFLTASNAKGEQMFGIRAGQSMTDLPGHSKPENPNAIGELFQAIVTGNKANVSADVGSALNTNTGASGGYTVPPSMRASLIDLATPRIPLSNLGMSIWDMTTGHSAMPKLLTRPTPEVKLEGEKFTESDMTFGLVNIVARMFGFTLKVSHELMMDSPMIQQIITSECAKAMAEEIAKSGIQGMADQGPGKRIDGLLTFDEIPETNVTGSSDEWLKWDHLADAALQVRLGDHTPTGALLNTATDHGLKMTKDADGRWLGSPPTVGEVRQEQTTLMPAGTALVGDFSNFAMGLREGVQVEASKYAGDSFERAIWTFRVMWRGNFALYDASAFHKLTDSTS